jgi:exopolyphosphatase/guanosine-5'-triphosphate,3'-diphosphate pyrophosphatase
VSETLAAIDIGTNSVHLVVALMADDGTFEVLAREKDLVRLGSGAGDMKELSPDAIERGIASLTRGRQVAEIHGARIHAVATSAVREAENAQVFIDRARAEAGIDVEVISGVEEARLIHLGVVQAVPVFDRQLVLIDIGGGSTEILVGRQADVLASASLKLGALRLTRRFFGGNRLHPSAVDACRRHVRANLVRFARQVRATGFEVAVGSSGTIEAVAAVVHATRSPDGPPPRSFNNFEFTRKEAKAVVKLLAGVATDDERRQLPGVDDKRADILLAGAIILEQAMAELGIERLTVSDYALREGVLLDAMQRERGATLHHLRDLRRSSVLRLAELMDDELDHSSHVATLALGLFDELRPLHKRSDGERELLEAAALLCNVGQFVSHDKHHKHSYYVIRNSDRLAGFTDHEIELIAQVARYHRKSAPKASHPEFAALRPADQDTVRALAGLLRVAVALDRSHAAAVRSVERRERKITKRTTEVTLDVLAEPDAELSLELYTAAERKGLLEAVLGVQVDIQVAPTDGSPS